MLQLFKSHCLRRKLIKLTINYYLLGEGCRMPLFTIVALYWNFVCFGCIFPFSITTNCCRPTNRFFIWLL